MRVAFTITRNSIYSRIHPRDLLGRRHTPCVRMAGEQQPVPGTLKDGLKDGWFTELSTMWPGQGMSFKVNDVIHTDRSDFQVRLHAHARGGMD